jgi:hypothetical protein
VGKRLKRLASMMGPSPDKLMTAHTFQVLFVRKISKQRYPLEKLQGHFVLHIGSPMSSFAPQSWYTFFLIVCGPFRVG